MAETTSELEKRFGIPGRVRIFDDGARGGLTVIELTHPKATASLSLLGGHVLDFRPKGGEPVLWVSPRTDWEPGKAIRGGIPICWPWFGPHPDSSQKKMPSHGFARTSLWQLKAVSILSGGETECTCFLEDNESTRALFPQSFRLRLIVTLSDKLRVRLETTNTGKEPWEYAGALHSYFQIHSIDSVRVQGLNGVRYLDKTDNMAQKTQSGDVVFSGETDRVYQDTDSVCRIDDGRRVIRVGKSNSRSTVVWNPGAEKSRQMGDMEDDGHQNMVCVETAQVFQDSRRVDPNQTEVLETTIEAAT